MKLPQISFSKDKLTELANAVGSATMEAVTTVSDNVRDGSEQLASYLDKTMYENDRKRLAPFFAEDLQAETFSLPQMIRLVDQDERRTNRACEGAIGFETNTKDMKVLNLYIENASMLDVSFYPFVRDTVYYVDPCYPDHYIQLDDYFAYLKKVRVDELETVAHALGAKHVKISLKEQKRSSSNQGGMMKFGIMKAGGEGSHQTSTNEMSTIEVAAEVDFAGGKEPELPELVYFKNESDVRALIQMRLNPNGNRILSKTYSFQYSNSSGIQVSDALKIDAALKLMRCNLSSSVVNEAKCESSMLLEYQIFF